MHLRSHFGLLFSFLSLSHFRFTCVDSCCFLLSLFSGDPIYESPRQSARASLGRNEGAQEVLTVDTQGRA